ncbi:MAG: selenium cofactor biosynthesis protein YqeC [Defluviitaleaceae bacterium]|nr:selenium cofactor biosynthesis protein YqeC [Defluviitaleaceae bacterium]
MKISEKLGLRTGDVVSVVGAGGKTTLIFRLARELAELGSKVLVATTTRMYFPESTPCGVCFLSGEPDENGKATPHAGLGKACGRFDYTLIEADGAKGKPLKGWADYEPVIIPETTKTVGVLNLGPLERGERAAPENIHRPDEYARLTGSKPGDIITIGHMRAVVSDGMFKNAAGEKILCVVGAAKAYEFEGVDKCVIL